MPHIILSISSILSSTLIQVSVPFMCLKNWGGPFTKYPHQLTAVSEKVLLLLSRFWLCHLFVIQLLSTPSFEILSNQRAKSVTWIKNIVAIPFRLRIWLDAAIRHELSPFNLVKISRIWNRFRALFVLMKS